jgi:hypothetical protein
MLWVWISIRERCTTLCDQFCQWLATGRWFSLGSLVSSINKTDRHDITEILLKVALNTIKQTNKHNIKHLFSYLRFHSLLHVYPYFKPIYLLRLITLAWIASPLLLGTSIDLYRWLNSGLLLDKVPFPKNPYENRNTIVIYVFF